MGAFFGPGTRGRDARDMIHGHGRRRLSFAAGFTSLAFSAPFPAHAQNSDNASVLIVAGFAPAPPTVTLNTAQQLSFGTVFRPNRNTSDCIYEITPAGIGLVDTTRTSPGAGCGFKEGLVQAGQLEVTCVAGGVVQIGTTIGTIRQHQLSYQLKPFVLRDTATDVTSLVPFDGRFTCPQSGSARLEVGLRMIVPSSQDISPTLTFSRLIISATIF